MAQRNSEESDISRAKARFAFYALPGGILLLVVLLNVCGCSSLRSDAGREQVPHKEHTVAFTGEGNADVYIDGSALSEGIKGRPGETVTLEFRLRNMSDTTLLVQWVPDPLVSMDSTTRYGGLPRFFLELTAGHGHVYATSTHPFEKELKIEETSKTNYEVTLYFLISFLIDGRLETHSLQKTIPVRIKSAKEIEEENIINIEIR